MTLIFPTQNAGASPFALEAPDPPKEVFGVQKN